MDTPEILALDFDGVLCEGIREYFETSRRTCRRVWPDEPLPGGDLFPAFKALRPVIESGWEMPVLLRAIARGERGEAMRRGWGAVRDRVVRESKPGGDALVTALRHAVDDVRREWIAADARDWLDHHAPYCALDEVRRLVASPEQAVVVTTKEGEFAGRILESWRVEMDGIQGKEAGSHKCDNLRALIEGYRRATGRRPRLWFVEDRLEALRHVATHPDLDDVGLFLAAWGYNTPETRATVDGRRVRLLALDRFRGDLAGWI